MQRAEVILSILGQKSRENPHFVFNRLYRYFFQPDFYVYVQQYTPFKVDQAEVDLLIKQLRSERYYPFVENGQSQNQHIDQLVQEMLYLLLWAIYQPLSTNFCQQEINIPRILSKLESVAKECHWVFQGKIKNFSTSISTEILLQTIRDKIQDGRLLELLRRFLFLHRNKIDREGVEGLAKKLSLLLEDLYLLPLDHFVQLLDSQLPSTNKLNYVRYGEEFLFFVKGSKQIAAQIQKKVTLFLEQRGLKLEQSGMIKQVRGEGAFFLNYQLVQSSKGKLLFLVPQRVIQQKLSPFMRNGKAVHHGRRIHLSVGEMIQQYNSEISGLYHYYRFAHDVYKKLGKFRYYHFGSLLKTIARKEQCSVKQVLSKYAVRTMKGKATIQVTYIDANQIEKRITYFTKPLKRVTKLL